MREVVAVGHVLGAPLGLLVEVGVIDQGIQAGGGAVLVGKGEEELLVVGAEGGGGPGERGARCRDERQGREHQRQTRDAKPAHQGGCGDWSDGV